MGISAEPSGNGSGEEYIPVPVMERGHMLNGVNAGDPSAEGKTPLMLAVQSGDLEVIFYLLERGADLTLRDKSGQTALDIAHHLKAQRIEQLLRQHLALHPPASEYYANKHPQITVIGGQNQVGAPGVLLFHPLSVCVTDSGKPLANAPVRFSVSPGEGKFYTSYNSPGSDWLVLRTDPEGICRVYFGLPKNGSAQRLMNAQAGGKPVQFLATSDPTRRGNSPFDASNVQAQMNSGGDMDVTWENHNDPDDITPTQLNYRDVNGNWVPLVKAPAGETHAHVPRN